MAKQSNLEKKALEKRHEELVRNDYQTNDPYSSQHPDAVSDGDPLGKGTNHGGHTHYLPDDSKPTTMIDYSNFDTFNGGGEYDIDGRNDIGGRKKLMTINIYNQDNAYGLDSVDTSANVADGQYVTS